MERKQFLKTVMAAVPLTVAGMKLNALNKITESLENTPKMPVLFLGHGSPMNAITENEFVQGFRKVSSEIEKPKAIVVVSAHWETQGTRVTAMEQPSTIHDFGGFPQELYEVQYPAPGMPELAQEVKDMVQTTPVHLDDKWGLDHGAWSVIRHMYPEADVPVIQLSLDYRKTPQEHYELAQELNKLREKGILIVGSGNNVHNLRMVHWGKLNENFGFDWANEANSKMKELILNGNHQDLINYSKMGRAFQLSIPTPEHYLPLLYALALQDKKDEISIFNDEPVGGSLAMTSVKIG
ncbi:4,5-DOPA dioxygenase extradiol [Draconibacterium sp. IB214405]|uniref:4,5-DOPA-extradiol-dioxygenase n=1 Tax=Draconibacterium sp. IB214405 TaxID=3097352 RepID=UPI002A137E2E|nr:4,5-DOPA dioxygenase extradiol [Draconibacterium sp. IB214405]MDX8340602.1 4,5-DOPA dioxygenase extradiol [Draconibacterium sp. IB214405]